jgi:4-amino-4-deoxy-L-arabinose transferase-like glycosyltransferase
MEAPLLLSYCGGIYHYLAWAASDDRKAARRHALAVGLCFTLGFMTKFVAAIFLPFTIGLSALVLPAHRRRLIADWKSWLASAAVAVALIAPWFVYATVRFGARKFWSEIFGTHVYTRLTAYLDPTHLHPWNFYFTQLWFNLDFSHTTWIVLAGAVLLVVDALRHRRADAAVVMLWFALPLAIISTATSKLYHYAYPFLPPVALAGGFAAAVVWKVAGPFLERILGPVGPYVTAIEARWMNPRRLAAAQAVAAALAVLALAVFVWTLITGALVLRWNGTLVFQNRRLLRPGLVAVALALMAAKPRWVARIAPLLLVLAVLPLPEYRNTFRYVSQDVPMLRPLRDCLVRINASPALAGAGGPRGMYVEGNGPRYESPFAHHFPYYFSAVTPWLRDRETPEPLLVRYLFDPAEARPVLIDEARYQQLIRSLGPLGKPAPNLAALVDNVLLVLPGPYEACLAEVRAAPRTP